MSGLAFVIRRAADAVWRALDAYTRQAHALAAQAEYFTAKARADADNPVSSVTGLRRR